jgi:hypothetical protein
MWATMTRRPTTLMKNIEKLLKATCPNHAYHVKHKLKEGSMMKNYMTIGALAKGKKLMDGAARNAAAPFPREKAIMSIYDEPVPHES